MISDAAMKAYDTRQELGKNSARTRQELGNYSENNFIGSFGIMEISICSNEI